MEALGTVGVVLMLVLALYPIVALGRIWLYSKQQVDLLREISSHLQRRP